MESGETTLDVTRPGAREERGRMTLPSSARQESSGELMTFEPELYDLGDGISWRRTGQIVTDGYHTATGLVSSCRNNLWYKAVASSILGLDSEERLELTGPQGRQQTNPVLVPPQSLCGLKPGVEMMTPLHLVAMQGKSVMAVSLLVCGADVNARVVTSLPGRRGCQATHLACQYGHTRMFGWLLYFGADPNAVDFNGNNCFVYALAAKKDRLKVLKAVRKAGAKIDERNNVGQTPLFYAVKWGYLEGIKFLLQHGAQISVVDDYGMNVVDFAAKHGRVDLAEFLLGEVISVRKESSLTLSGRILKYFGLQLFDPRIEDPDAVLKMLELRASYSILQNQRNAKELLVETLEFRRRLERQSITSSQSQSQSQSLARVTDVQEPNSIDFILKFSRRHMLWVSLLILERNLGDCQETTLAMAQVAKELIRMGEIEEALSLMHICADRLQNQTYHNVRSIVILQHLWNVVDFCTKARTNEGSSASMLVKYTTFKDIFPVLETNFAVIKAFKERVETMEKNIVVEQCLWLAMRTFISFATVLTARATEKEMKQLIRTIGSLIRLNPVAWGSNILHVALTINSNSFKDSARGSPGVVRLFMGCSRLVAKETAAEAEEVASSTPLHLAEDKNGHTPLHLASMTMGDADLTTGGMLATFKDSGANFDQMNRQGLTPGDILLMRGMKVYIWSRLLFAWDFIGKHCSPLAVGGALLAVLLAYVLAYNSRTFGMVLLCLVMSFAIVICAPFIDDVFVQRFWFIRLPDFLRRSMVRGRRVLRQHVVDTEVSSSTLR